MAAVETTKATAEQPAALPATFPERGASIPFTTPALAHACVRELDTRARTEVLIPSLIGSHGAYVIPLRTLPETITLTVFDRALHEEMMRTRAITPPKIRQAAIQLARAGLAGPADMQQARGQEMTDQLDRLKTFMGLIRSAVEVLSNDSAIKASVAGEAIAGPRGMELARDAFAGCADKVAATPGDIVSRLEVWAKIIGPIGTPHAGTDGYLTRTVADMQRFAADLDKWQTAEPQEFADMAGWVIKICQQTAGLCRDRIEAIHDCLGDMETAIRGWKPTEKTLLEKAEQLSWLTDGWSPIIAEWNKVSRINRFEQRDYLERMVQFVPNLPREVLTNDETAMWVMFGKQQKHWLLNAEQRGPGDSDLTGLQEKLSKITNEG